MKEFIIKHKKPCIAVAALAVVVALAVALSLLTKRPAPVIQPDTADTSSAESVAEITIEAPDSTDDGSENELLPDSDNYIAPDESDADKLLNESTPTTPAVEAPQITVAPSSNAAATPSEPLLSDEELKKREEEGRQQTRDKARQYLDEHNIDYATAGFTGENCRTCGRPIWDSNKYGLAIPGLWINFGIPEDAVCTGFCGVIFE